MLTATATDSANSDDAAGGDAQVMSVDDHTLTCSDFEPAPNQHCASSLSNPEPTKVTTAPPDTGPIVGCRFTITT